MEEIINYIAEEFIKNLSNRIEDFYDSPEDLAEFIISIRKETDEIARRTVQAVVQELDGIIKNLPARKKQWYVEHKGDGKKLLTSVGEISFKKTLYVSKSEVGKDGKPLTSYLLDEMLNVAPNQSMTEDTIANIYKEAVQTSYRKAGEIACPEGVTKETVKNLLHRTRFPENFSPSGAKKEVKYLYIEADEDHYHLQFNEHKGDLKRGDDGRKLNGAINKIIYVHEGIEPEALKSKRNRLINTHYFCRGDGQDNKELWEEVFSYIAATYDMEKIHKLYISADGAAWIRSGYRGLADGVVFVLDEFHLSKYVAKMTGHMLDSEGDAKSEIYECIRNKTKGNFRELTEKLKACTDMEEIHDRIEEASKYIESNWTAAKLRLRKSEGVIGSSTEGHVYHVLSSRMSTQAMGWSRRGGAQMAHLREYYYNGGDMLELAKYQKEELPMAVGSEDVILSANAVFKSERTQRTKYLQECGKYEERMKAHLSTQGSKILMFNLNARL